MSRNEHILEEVDEDVGCAHVDVHEVIVVLRERVIQVACENDTRTVDQHVKLWLILLLLRSLVESGLSALRLSLLKIVQIDELVLDCFNEVLALVIIRDVSDDDCGLVRELRCAVFEGLLVLTDENHVCALVEVPKSECLPNTGRRTGDHNTLVHKIVYVLGLLHVLFLEGGRDATGEGATTPRWLLLLHRCLHLLLVHHRSLIVASWLATHVVLAAATVLRVLVWIIGILLRRPTSPHAHSTSTATK